MSEQQHGIFAPSSPRNNTEAVLNSVIAFRSAGLGAPESRSYDVVLGVQT